MEESLIKETLSFIKTCDDGFLNEDYSAEKIEIAKSYIRSLSKIDKGNKTNIIVAILNKLRFIVNQLEVFNYHANKPESILNLVSLSVTDYIINYIQKRHITDPLLIARAVYRELSSCLYYDISYIKQKSSYDKSVICNAAVDVKKEKIFSYVVCTQWFDLYAYILKCFGIQVIKRNIPGQDHVWGEIPLNDDSIIIVDATDYIDSSIDLSNAKSVSPTVGFVVLPKSFSGIKLYDVFNNKDMKEIAEKVKDCYKLNRELDISLGYIGSAGYKVDRIIEENDLFHYPSPVITNQEDLKKYTKLAINFFNKLSIPNNIDGYEIFAYYSKFIKHLPKNIAANISLQTMYVDAFSYKQDRMHKTFLHAPMEYLEYLDGLVYSRYYKYLSNEEDNIVLEQIKQGIVNGEQVRDLIVKYEMKIAEINRRLNFYYAINKMHFYDPISYDTLGIQLYEPMMGSKKLNSIEELDEFKRTILLK